MGRGWRWWLGSAAAVGGGLLLSGGAAFWLLQEPAAQPLPVRAKEPRPILREPILEEGGTLDPREVVAVPEGPLLAAAHGERPPAKVQWLRRCGAGDALVTVERLQAGTTWVVVHRGGRACFRIPFADDPDQAPASLRIHGTVDAAGEAGPLAIVHTSPLPPHVGDEGFTVRREELHLLLVDLGGRILLERTLESRATAVGAWGGALSLVPLIWEDETLVAWSSARRWKRGASQCLGSLLRMERGGPVAVAEGVPCEAAGAVDVDGDGRVEIAAATSAADGTPWEAIVTTAGDFAATWTGALPPRLVGTGPSPALLAPPATPLGGSRWFEWPWTEEGAELPPDDGVRFSFDRDGDGVEEVVLGRNGSAWVVDRSGRRLERIDGTPRVGRVDGSVRELLVDDPHCGLAAVAPGGARRCAPGDVGALARIASVGRSFDWTGDGTADVTAIGTGADGTLLLAAWAEGDLAFAWTAQAVEELPPRHQAPRALALSGPGKAEVLVATREGFAVRSVPEGAVRWEGLSKKGVVDAWALPASGPSAVAVQ